MIYTEKSLKDFKEMLYDGEEFEKFSVAQIRVGNERLYTRTLYIASGVVYVEGNVIYVNGMGDYAFVERTRDTHGLDEWKTETGYGIGTNHEWTLDELIPPRSVRIGADNVDQFVGKGEIDV